MQCEIIIPTKMGIQLFEHCLNVRFPLIPLFPLPFSSSTSISPSMSEFHTIFPLKSTFFLYCCISMKHFRHYFVV